MQARHPQLRCEHLEPIRLFSATAILGGSVLEVMGAAGVDNRLRLVSENTTIRVFGGTTEIASFDSSAVATITIHSGGVNDTVIVDPNIRQPATIVGGGGRNKLVAGGGKTDLIGGNARDHLFGGRGEVQFNGLLGENYIYRAQPDDSIIEQPGNVLLGDFPVSPGKSADETITELEVETILRRAAAASASRDAIIVIVDRNGTILGVRVESQINPELLADKDKLAFAIDGAVALARTGAFFGNNDAPLTSRTVQFISQSTITEREVNSNPNITDPNSTARGPGFVAPVGVGGHFPPRVNNTPQVDLFQIEHTNRDGRYSPGPDRIMGTVDDVLLSGRFNLNHVYVPEDHELQFLDGYGAASGLVSKTANGVAVSQNRGIATLPGGVPIFKNGQVVGGIGVFFPGRTGYATEMNSELSTTYDPSKPDRSLEAEWIAYAAVGGTRSSVGGVGFAPVDDLGGVALPAGFGLPSGRIDLVGITLDIFGRGGPNQGLDKVLNVGNAVGRGSAEDGVNMPVDPSGITVKAGQPVPSGWLVLPHDGDGIRQAEVERIISQGLDQARKTRAAIRLPIGNRAKFVFAVADRQGNIVGLYREPDATVFSIDVAIAKARNVAYYANPEELQAEDRLEAIPAGTAFTNRTFRYVGQPRYPEGIDGEQPGPFSQLNDGGADPFTGRQVGPPLPASAYQSVVGYDAFNPGTNFRDPFNTHNQNGIVFFPGSAPVYRSSLTGLDALVGGFGVSGDGVDQDDVATAAGQVGFGVPANILRADQVYVRGVRLPYQKFNRNPEG